MSDAQFVAALSLIISLGFLLVIWWWLSGYRNDSLRDQLFTIRDEMFLYVLDHGIADTAAHENLRLLMNSLIRYAHRVSFGRLLLLDLSRRLFKVQRSTPALYGEWAQAVDELPADEAQRMRDFHDSANFVIMKHMISGSPLLLLYRLSRMLSLTEWSKMSRNRKTPKRPSALIRPKGAWHLLCGDRR